MTEFNAKRVSHECFQENHGSPEQVFPLLCPVREAEWVPGWQYRLIYSQSGVAEAGCVFVTPNDDGSETTWITTYYDPAAYRVEYAWVHPGKVATQLRIALSPLTDGKTRAHIRYTYTALSPAGNAEVERFNELWFRRKMQSWEAAINYYLREGKKMGTTTWE